MLEELRRTFFTNIQASIYMQVFRTPDTDSIRALCTQAAFQKIGERDRFLYYKPNQGLFQLVPFIGNPKVDPPKRITDTEYLPAALAETTSTKENGKPDYENTIFLFENAQTWEDGAKATDDGVAALLGAWDHARTTGNILVFAGARFWVPPETYDYMEVKVDMPDRGELEESFDRAVAEIENGAKERGTKAPNQLSKEQKEEVITALQGLQIREAETAVVLTAKQTGYDSGDGVGRYNLEVLTEIKTAMIQKDDMVEVFNLKDLEGINDVGGASALKEFLLKRRDAWSPEAEEFGVPPPKGVLLVGIPGTGKSLFARIIAKIFQLALFRIDMGKSKGSLMGETESRNELIRKRLKAYGRCVAWLDEIGLAMQGSDSSGSTDGGTMANVIGSWLTFMQEQRGVYFVGTTNNIDDIPKAMLRKGRFDEIFYVGLPDEEACREIFQIHLHKRKRRMDEFNLDALAQYACERKFVGAEIEEAVIAGIIDAYYARKDLSTEDIMNAMKVTRTQFDTNGDELRAMEEWAKTNARNAAQVKKVAVATGRRVN